MQLTLNLPDDLARRLSRLLPEREIGAFTLFALENAAALKEKECDDKIADSLLAKHDPHVDPEREAAEVRAIVEEELKDIDDLSKTITLEEFRQEMDDFWAARKQQSKP